MYLEFYRLGEKPFSQTPDPRFLYWNDAYREALASLSYGIRERKGFLTMIGEAGTGKTTLLRKLLDELGSEVVSVLLFNPNATFEEILEYTLSELGISVPSGRKLAMLQRLNEFLLAAFAEGRNTILLIDEAQDLASDVLESLRLLSNLETSQEKILQIVLSGQPELAARLAEPGLRQLKQRIAVRCRLEPLKRPELGQYIAARIGVAGGAPDLFAAETLDPIWAFAEGIPRLINMVCDNALLVGYALGRRQIDRAVIDEVVADLRRLDVEFASADSSDRRPESILDPPRIEIPANPEGAPAEGIRHSTAAPGAARTPSTDATPVPDGAKPPGQAAVSTPPGERTQGPRRATRWLTGTLAALGLVALGGALALWLQTLQTGPLSAPWGGPAARSSDELRARLAAQDRAVLRSDASGREVSLPDGRQGPFEPGSSSEDGRAAVKPLRDEGAVPEARKRALVGVTGKPVPSDDAPPDSPADAGVASETAPASPPDEPLRTVDAANEALPEVEPPEASLAIPGNVGSNPAGGESSKTGAAEEKRAAAIQAPSPGMLARGAEAAPSALKGKRVQVRLGDTLSNLASRAYGRANLTTLDMLRERNPGITDIDLIREGTEIEFPDPGPDARILLRTGGVSVLVLTTPALSEALALQERLEARYQLPVDVEPTELGRLRDLYRVSIRAVNGRKEALEISGSLGSILGVPES